MKVDEKKYKESVPEGTSQNQAVLATFERLGGLEYLAAANGEYNISFFADFFLKEEPSWDELHKAVIEFVILSVRHACRAVCMELLTNMGIELEVSEAVMFQQLARITGMDEAMRDVLIDAGFNDRDLFNNTFGGHGPISRAIREREERTEE